MTIERVATCDLCGEVKTYHQDSVAPEQWGSLRIVGSLRLYKEYAICPMCMPPVEGPKGQRPLPPEKAQEARDFAREAAEAARSAG